ncbi:hypothetical protein [Caballeronia sp. Lep1P3]|uniref:hypothetical protein n=1 Tax=Caballeronia sp. Lep1P3 TaxID=2878150 RepID=UPI001FD01141|nr:hypothetical protein [Caballeronia sp. Lep1P3]
MTIRLSDACRSRLFRVTLTAPVQGVAFLMADSREAAWRMSKTAIAVLNSIVIYDVALTDVHSFSELVTQGADDDEDMRVFETGRGSAGDIQWADAPYFLTNDSSLLGKWAELRAELAANMARSVIKRAK